MVTEAVSQQILDKLTRLEKEVIDIKEHMVDVDSILSEDDFKALLDYRRDKSEGKMIAHDQLKRELGL